MPDLLIELFSEEIPARMQARAAQDLKKLVTDGLVDAGLTYASAGAFATPRSLTLSVEGLSERSPDLREERRGPRADAPEKAIAGFLRGAGLTRDQVEERETPKGAMLFAVIDKPGREAEVIVGELLAQTVRTFPWPKSMRWGDKALRWVRPLQSILCVLSDEAGARVVPGEVDGFVFGDTTEGHRFMAPGRFGVTGFEDYSEKLARAHVVLDPAIRAETIWADATNLAFAAGLEVVEDKALLAEVAGLVEWPVVLMGEIGADFLDLPPEVLQTSMREHQKFFSVRDKTGRITRFITVANRETADDGATILAGNQKVLAARLADAKFFWENDLRVATSDISVWTKTLQNVTFHNKLGSVAEKIDRVAALARDLAPVVGANPDQAERAARLAKADLSSEMVNEFPELQGLMGRYYLAAAGHAPEIAAAAEDHYAPLGPSDDVPTAPVSVAVALADKIDTLTGFWAIDEKPTGSKDPFALRRAALGVIRSTVETNISLSFGDLVEFGFWQHAGRVFAANKVRPSFFDIQTEYDDFRDLVPQTETRQQLDAAFAAALEPNKFAEHEAKTLSQKEIDLFRWLMGKGQADLLSFIHERLKVYLRDQGIRHDIIDACLAMPNNDDLTLLVNRARALNAALGTDDGENLIQGFKRANNILTQAEEKDGVEYSYGADRKWTETEEERALFDALDAAEAEITPAMAAQDFTRAMHAMAGLRAPIDAFFEAVKINADNETVRRNRLNLLSRIRTTCLSVADLTRLDG